MNTGQDRVVLAHPVRSREPNKINRFGMRAHYPVQSQANCKTGPAILTLVKKTAAAQAFLEFLLTRFVLTVGIFVGTSAPLRGPWGPR
jgi:hypothetical protein